MHIALFKKNFFLFFFKSVYVSNPDDPDAYYKYYISGYIWVVIINYQFLYIGSSIPGR